MDQLKVVLQAVKKHHFWILCGVIVVLVLAVWWSATSGLAGLIDKRQGELQGKMDSVKNISSASEHPNQDVIDGLKRTRQDLTDGVASAWNLLYNRQKALLQWPALGYGFRDYMERLPSDAPIVDSARDTYMNSIQRHYPKKLYEIVEMRLPVLLDEKGNPERDENGNLKKIDPFENTRAGPGYSDVAEGPAMAGMSGYSAGSYEGGGYSGTTTSMQGELVGKVDWNRADLKRIRDQLYWPNRPLSIQVRVAQEDLWVYEALAQIVAATNREATSYYNAAVKRIDALEIGQRAAAAFALSRGEALRVGGMGSMSGYPGAETAMSAGYMQEMQGSMGDVTPGDMSPSGMGPTYAPGGALATGASAEEQLKAKLLGNRYVDREGKPVGADETIEGEFKMMPVRMLLLIDQRKITRLLIECANCPLPVEVTKLALNPGKGSLDFAKMGGSVGTYRSGGSFDEEGSSMTGMPGYPGAGPMMSGSTYEYEDESAGMGMQSEMGPMGRRGEQQTSYDVPLEVQGIIYVFNRPDSAKFGGGAAGQGAADEATAVPAAEAASAMPATGGARSSS